MNQLVIFAIDGNTGVLKPASTPSVPVGSEPISVGIDPSSRFVYVVNRTGKTISQINRNAMDGSLTPMSVPTVTVSSRPWQIHIDPSGQLAYVGPEDASLVNIYSIGTDGALTLYSSAPTGAAPSGIAVAGK